MPIKYCDKKCILNQNGICQRYLLVQEELCIKNVRRINKSGRF